ADTHGTGDKEVPTQQQIGLTTDLAELKKQHAQTRFERMNAERRLTALKAQEKMVKDAPPPITEAELGTLLDADTIAKGHQVRLDKLRQIIKEYERAGTRADEPTLVRAREQIQEAQKGLDERKA